MRNMRVLVGLLAAIALIIGAVPNAWAANGGIQVTVYEVTSSGNEPLPGAQVILRQPSGQYPETALFTDANGQALFPVVPSGGGYEIRVAMPGYGTVVRDDVRVVAGQISPVVVALQAELKEVVEVKAKEQIIDLDSGESTTAISDDFFADLPVLGREYQNVLTLAPGVNDTDGDGNPTVHGSRARDFKLTVDGVSNVDPLTGQFMSNINPDAIEEIEVIDAGADASFGGAAGGFGRIITKSGGNQFEGSVNILFRDSAFDNDQAGNIDPQDFGWFQPAFYLSGPIVRDHLWFMASHEYIDVKLPVDLVIGADFVRKFTQLRSFDKLTWQAGPKNKLQLQYSADPIEVEPVETSSRIPFESGSIGKLGGPAFTFKWTVPYSATFFWETTVAFQDRKLEQFPVNRFARNSCVSNAEGDFAYWGELSCVDDRSGGIRSGPYFRDYEDQRSRWSYSIDAEQYVDEWLGGSHQIKFGLQTERAEFSRLEYRPNSLRLNELPGSADFFNQINVARFSLSETVYVPKSDPLDLASTSLNDDVSRGNFYDLYINDTYRPFSNLVFNIGLRFSREEISGTGFTQFDPRSERRAWEQYLDRCMNGEIPGIPVASANPRTCLAFF
ncbi:MAG: TonB-dependent receptor, partial [Acidobacteriota bacterium]